ncbi:MAG: hypothetical protein QXP93_03745 [Nitrososphaerota archaeon]
MFLVFVFQLPLSGSPFPIPGFSGSARLPAAPPPRTNEFFDLYFKITVVIFSKIHIGDLYMLLGARKIESQYQLNSEHLSVAEKWYYRGDFWYSDGEASVPILAQIICPSLSGSG